MFVINQNQIMNTNLSALKDKNPPCTFQDSIDLGLVQVLCFSFSKQVSCKPYGPRNDFGSRFLYNSA